MYQTPISKEIARISPSLSTSEVSQCLSNILDEDIPSHRPEFSDAGLSQIVDILLLDDQSLSAPALDILCRLTEDNDASSDYERILSLLSKKIGVLLRALPVVDFYVRYPTLQLLTRILEFDSGAVERELLGGSAGTVHTMVDLLTDENEIVRNDGLLLMTGLVRVSADLAQIVAFQNGFEQCFDIVRVDGLWDGTVVTVDALSLIASLLSQCPANASIFKSSGFVARIAPLLSPPASAKATMQGISRCSDIVCVALNIINALVKSCGATTLSAGAADAAAVAAANRELAQTVGVFVTDRIVELLLELASGTTGLNVEVDIAALGMLQPIIAVSDEAQGLLLTHVVDTASESPCTALLCIFRAALCDNQPHRAAAAMSVAKIVAASPRGSMFAAGSVRPLPQGISVQDVLAPPNAPKTSAAASITVGQTLVTALLADIDSSDARRASSATAAAALTAQVLAGNDIAKQMLGEAPWQGGSSGGATTFADALVRSLVRSMRNASSSPASTIALFRVLLAWVDDYPALARVIKSDDPVMMFFVQSCSSEGASSEVAKVSAALSAVLLMAMYCSLPTGGVGTPDATQTNEREQTDASSLLDIIVRHIGVDSISDHVAALRETALWNRGLTVMSAQQYALGISDSKHNVGAIVEVFDESYKAFLDETIDRANHTIRVACRDMFAASGRSPCGAPTAMSDAEASALRATLVRTSEDLKEVEDSYSSYKQDAAQKIAALEKKLEEAALSDDSTARVADLEAQLASSCRISELKAAEAAIRQLEDDQTELYALLGEYHNRLVQARKQLRECGRPCSDDDEEVASITLANGN